MKIKVKTQPEHDLDYLLERAVALQRALKGSGIYLGTDYELYITENAHLVSRKLKDVLKKGE